MGVHVRVPGKACRALEASERVVEWESFLAGLLIRGRSLTRLDVALDDRSGSVTVERCYGELKAGNLVHRFRTVGAAEFMDRLGVTQSRTLYFGSTASDVTDPHLRQSDRNADAGAVDSGRGTDPG